MNQGKRAMRITIGNMSSGWITNQNYWTELSNGWARAFHSRYGRWPTIAEITVDWRVQ